VVWGSNIWGEERNRDRRDLDYDFWVTKKQRFCVERERERENKDGDGDE
jgi:hypothetical protein